METSGTIPNPLDLTGQLSVLEYMPKFNGNYSSVFLGELNGNSVAIKVIKPTGRDESVKRKFLREVRLWASTSHPNIQPFYGFANDRMFGTFGALVSPWCLNGDATEYLQQNGGRMVMEERINLWKGVIEGVAYLHHHNPIIIHGDLKLGNVLIDDRGVPRICDFGLARVFLEAEITDVTTTSEHTGATRYLAPELVASEENVYPTAASDLYALGCLGLEIIYDQKPYSNRPNNLRGQIVRDIRRSLPPAPSPPHQGWAYQHTWSLIKQMWSLDPSHRPSASNAFSVLNYTARSIPLVFVQRIAHVSASADWYGSSNSEWIERTRALLTLSLVSKSFCACATPFLYRDIRLQSKVTASRLSSLLFTLNSSVKHSRTCDYLPGGYGSYTRSLLLCIDKEAPGLSVDIPNLLYKMSRLHTLAIQPNENFLWDPALLRTPSLSTMCLSGVHVPFFLSDQVVIQPLLLFRQLVIYHHNGLYFQPPDVLHMIHTSLLLPNLQHITLRLEIAAENLLQVFIKWVMPRLKSLNCTLVGLENCAAFINLLRTHGPLLWYLRVELNEVDSPPVSDILSLCSNLRSFVLVAYTQPSSLPPHPQLEILDIEATHYVLGVKEEVYLARLDGLTSSWRVKFPSLRCASFMGRMSSFGLKRYPVDVEMKFCTGDNFYTLIDGGMIYKRWEGSWIGIRTPTIHVESPNESSLVPSLPVSGPLGPPAPQPPPKAEQVDEGAAAIALYGYDAAEENEITFAEGDHITNIFASSDDWWEGTAPNGQTGFFPVNYVELKE